MMQLLEAGAMQGRERAAGRAGAGRGAAAEPVRSGLTRRALGRRLLGLLLAIGIVAVAPQAEATGRDRARRDLNPIVFVHGGSGSGAQFQSQAQRFTSNGYPQHLLRVVEYDSSSIATILPQVLAQIDAVIAELQESTGRPQVDLIGHSLGTFVSQLYLGSPERAANVAHYINVDGRPAAALPGGVPTLALFAGAARDVQGEIVGARNVTIPDQEHVEVMTSAEAFVEMFTFLTGEPPRTSRIRRSLLPRFPVSGRAVIFPQNVGADGALLLVFELDRRTGARRRSFFRPALPEAVFTIDETGDFGPFRARRNTSYEFVLLREGGLPHHFYFEPFRRSDHLVRLNTSLPDEGIGAFVERDPAHVALSISRNKEFRGDRGPGENDVLLIDRRSVLTPENAPSGFVGAPVAFFAFDVGSDRVDDLATVPAPFGMLPFLTAGDLFVSAERRRTVSIVTVPRGERAKARRIQIRTRPSTEARISVQLNDFE